MVKFNLHRILNFKIAVIILLFSLTVFRLFSILLFPNVIIISDKVIFIVLLVLLGYLWIKEMYDRRELVKLNLNLVKAQEELKKANFGIIASLFLAEEAKDYYTKGHCTRVTEYATLIAQDLGLEGVELEIIERAGMLHDLGKINIEDAILQKPDKLSEVEWEVIKRHSQKGAELLKPLDFLAEERRIILHHHERYDGSGYPEKLKDKVIPLGSRILAVADSFDAMNSERPYRKALEKEHILKELIRGKDTQFDGYIVDVFIKVLEKNPQIWSERRHS